MSRHERNPDYFAGKSWSRYHRASQPDDASMIDIDTSYTRFCKRCGKTLLLVEDTKDMSRPKPATAIRQLALDAGVPAWRVYIEGNPVRPRCLHVQQIAPTETAIFHVSPETVDARLLKFQAEHDLICSDRPPLYDASHGAPTDEPPPPQPADTDDAVLMFGDTEHPDTFSLSTDQQSYDFDRTGHFTPDPNGWTT